MKGKALLIALGVLTLIASLAVAQVAYAIHETAASTKPITGSVVPGYKQCGSYDSTSGLSGTGENWGSLTGDNTGGARFHAAPVNFPSCEVTGTGPGGSQDKSALLTPHAFTSGYTVKTVKPSPADDPSTTQVEGWGSSDAVDVITTSTSSGTYCENAALFTGGASGLLARNNCGDVVNNSTGADGSDGVADSGPTTYNATFCNTQPSTALCKAYNHGKFQGTVGGESRIRTTDAENCAAPCDTGTLHGTVQDFNFTVKIACVAGACNSTTTADAQFGPSYVPNLDPTIIGKKGNVEIFSILVKDPGPNGTYGTGCPIRCGDGDEQIAARTGLYIN